MFDIKNLINDAQGFTLLYVEDNKEAREATYALLSKSELIFSNSAILPINVFHIIKHQ